jgi:hypothetical protein
MDKALALLDKEPSMISVALRTGLNYFWLTAMKNRRIKNPGVLSVEKLYRALSQEK